MATKGRSLQNRSNQGRAAQYLSKQQAQTCLHSNATHEMIQSAGNSQSAHQLVAVEGKLILEATYGQAVLLLVI
jgi:hypothetical protein